jgi:hypothetical protein
MQPLGRTEHDPVLDSELVLRRIHKNQYKPGRAVPITSNNFEPHEHDTDGLSLHREGFVSVSDVAAWGPKGGNYYIARVSVSVLRGHPYFLTLDPTPDPNPANLRGHTSLRELSIESYRADEAKGNDLCRDLAKLFSKHIVHVPSGCML